VPSQDPALLSTEAAIRYWDTRHRRHGELRSGGHIGLDEPTNEFFYLLRLGKLLELIGDLNSPDEPMFLLDAGCGKGRIAAALSACGFRVDGIDTSEAAIAACRSRGAGRYEVASLSGWRSPVLYDVVLSVDVLFHVLDDAEWRASVRNLASLVRLGGKLVLSDEYREDPRQAGDYIVHRPWRSYLDLIGGRGFTFEGFSPYRFRDNQVGYLVFRRTH
jgi:2-polyprenyl-3-methyl-5-hydroxy-6-metoxy-1,4-benzoquinol methylase